jgi:pimeloyl-ACP methyl ester carboxylesterase
MSETTINSTTAPKSKNSISKIFFGSLPKTLISSLLLLAILYVALCSYVLSVIPGSLFDNKVSWAPVPAYGYNLEFIRNSAGQNLSLWELQNPKTDSVILYLHGNSGRINDFMPDLYTAGGTVYSIAYPGYHESEGSPTPDSVNEAAVLAYDEIVNKKGIPESKITILGHSMGGSPATYLASVRPNAKKLVLINTFSSVQSMCMRQLSILCAFTGKVFNSASLAKDVKIPVRQFAYKNDLNVPFNEGEKLYENFTGTTNKSFTIMDKNTHTYPDWSLIGPELAN